MCLLVVDLLLQLHEFGTPWLYSSETVMFWTIMMMKMYWSCMKSGSHLSIMCHHYLLL